MMNDDGDELMIIMIIIIVITKIKIIAITKIFSEPKVSK